MLIMPATTRDFHEMAAAVVADFFENGVPLVKGIAERAKSAQLVPEEVRRLTEKANTAAMLRLLKMEGRGKDIFSLARVEDVLALTHPTHEQSDALSEVGGDKRERGAAEEKAVSWPTYVFSLIARQSKYLGRLKPTYMHLRLFSCNSFLHCVILRSNNGSIRLISELFLVSVSK